MNEFEKKAFFAGYQAQWQAMQKQAAMRKQAELSQEEKAAIGALIGGGAGAAAGYSFSPEEEALANAAAYGLGGAAIGGGAGYYGDELAGMLSGAEDDDGIGWGSVAGGAGAVGLAALLANTKRGRNLMAKIPGVKQIAASKPGQYLGKKIPTFGVPITADDARLNRWFKSRQ
jgi:hypothetical protein